MDLYLEFRIVCLSSSDRYSSMGDKSHPVSSRKAATFRVSKQLRGQWWKRVLPGRFGIHGSFQTHVLSPSPTLARRFPCKTFLPSSKLDHSQEARVPFLVFMKEHFGKYFALRIWAQIWSGSSLPASERKFCFQPWILFLTLSITKLSALFFERP